MATVRFNYSATFHASMLGAPFEGLFEGAPKTATATKLVFDFSGGGDTNFLTFSGSGLSYVKSAGLIADITGGTVTSMTEALNGSTGFSLSGLSMSGAAFFDSAIGTEAQQFDLIMGGNDVVYGRDLAVKDEFGETGDELRGWTGNDTIYGLNGNDTIFGEKGNDSLVGGNGNDYLAGGLGKDVLVGGAGKDIFVFNTALSASSNVDHITSFSRVDDIIRLDDAVFTGIGARGALTAAAMWHGTAAHDASDRIILDTATGNLYFDRDGTGSAAKVLFAVVTPGLALDQTDFLII